MTAPEEDLDASDSLTDISCLQLPWGEPRSDHRGQISGAYRLNSSCWWQHYLRSWSICGLSSCDCQAECFKSGLECKPASSQEVSGLGEMWLLAHLALCMPRMHLLILKTSSFNLPFWTVQ